MDIYSANESNVAPRVIELITTVWSMMSERETRERYRDVNDCDSERESVATCGETRGATASALEINTMDTENSRRATFISRDIVCERTTGSTRNRMCERQLLKVRS